MQRAGPGFCPAGELRKRQNRHQLPRISYVSEQSHASCGLLLFWELRFLSMRELKPLMFMQVFHTLWKSFLHAVCMS